MSNVGGGIQRRINADGFYTYPQAAQILGKHPETVRHWVDRGLVEPRTMVFGELEVPVLSPSDIETLRREGVKVPQGRPPKGLAPMVRSEDGKHRRSK